MSRADLFANLDRWATKRPDAMAVEGPDGKVTYAQLIDLVHAASTRWRGAGTVPGHRIGLSLRNDVASVVEFLGLAGTGAVPVLYDEHATDAERDRVSELAKVEHWWSPAALPVSDSPAELTEPEALALVSSGTGGMPKVVRKNWAVTMANSAASADIAGLTQDDRILCCTPLHHAYAFGMALLPSLLTGSALVFAPSPATLATMVEQSGATVLQAVPFQYRSLLATGRVRAHRLRLCLAAGEQVPGELVREWRDTTGLDLRVLYGCTELGQIALSREGADDGFGELLDGMSARTLRDAETKGADEILLRQPGEPASYLGLPELTASAYHEGWFRTRDHGRVDGRRVAVEGRLSRRIVVAGRKIDPIEVERAVEEIPGVRECWVGEPPHDVPTSVCEGFVAFLAGEPEITELGVRRHLARRLSSYKVPTRFQFVDKLPRTRSGKIHVARLWREAEWT